MNTVGAFGLFCMTKLAKHGPGLVAFWVLAVWVGVTPAAVAWVVFTVLGRYEGGFERAEKEKHLYAYKDFRAMLDDRG